MGIKSIEQYRVDFIDVIKRTIATNLTNKGTSANATESLQALANKIANVNTGKKWASGTIPSSPIVSGYDGGGLAGSWDPALGGQIDIYGVSGLSFTPGYIFIWGLDGSGQFYYRFYNKDIPSVSYVYVYSANNNPYGNPTLSPITARYHGNIYVYNGGFKFKHGYGQVLYLSNYIAIE
jgi:hypothetical protein